MPTKIVYGQGSIKNINDYIKGRKAKQLFLSYLLSKCNNRHTSMATVEDMSDLVMQFFFCI